MLKKNEIIQLYIDDISVDGAGIGRLDGQIVFVQNSLPGELVSAKVIKAKKNYSIAILIETIERSEHRVDPFCAVFNKCGGCTLQHLDYEQQLVFKANHIKQCFLRIGGIEIVTPKIIPAENKREYRNKASFPTTNINSELQAGFYAPHSHRVVPSDCAIQKPIINDIKNTVVSWTNKKGIATTNKATGATLRHIVARQSSNGQVMAGIVTEKPIADDELIKELSGLQGVVSIVQNINNKSTNAILGDKTQTLFGDSYITERYDDLDFKASLESFLQVNHDQTQKLYETALNFASINKSDIVFDLFCGIGTITLLAAKRAKKVVGIEYVQIAVENARSNAELNGIDNAIFLAGDASDMLSAATDKIGSPDIVILDPPRKGCDEELLLKLADLKPKRIVYVSCSPATLARDSKLLINSGYNLSDIIGVDMFPQTTHVETVVLMSRVEK